jgi:hypothetical protein
MLYCVKHQANTPILLARTFLFRFCHRYSVRGAFEICQRLLWGDETAIFGVSWALSDTVNKNAGFLTFHHDIKKPPRLGKVCGYK